MLNIECVIAPFFGPYRERIPEDFNNALFFHFQVKVESDKKRRRSRCDSDKRSFISEEERALMDSLLQVTISPISTSIDRFFFIKLFYLRFSKKSWF